MAPGSAIAVATAACTATLGGLSFLRVLSQDGSANEVHLTVTQDTHIEAPAELTEIFANDSQYVPSENLLFEDLDDVQTSEPLALEENFSQATTDEDDLLSWLTSLAEKIISFALACSINEYSLSSSLTSLSWSTEIVLVGLLVDAFLLACARKWCCRRSKAQPLVQTRSSKAVKPQRNACWMPQPQGDTQPLAMELHTDLPEEIASGADLPCSPEPSEPQQPVDSPPAEQESPAAEARWRRASMPGLARPPSSPTTCAFRALSADAAPLGIVIRAAEPMEWDAVGEMSIAPGTPSLSPAPLSNGSMSPKGLLAEYLPHSVLQTPTPMAGSRRFRRSRPPPPEPAEA
eukprot:TRINITY_DN62970_c0_g1_i1.p1 TRINITY_DN62970_c0_g1~~TRINITY_DN62970_c0_g1_i1.p1  ORF type:complete len:367 (+),score=58.66 TRINITY_DN62970_c0_g1_i1:63-1103(+)